jgi:hypothetical protein
VAVEVLEVLAGIVVFVVLLAYYLTYFIVWIINANL